jgi:glutamine amidotransferase
MTGRIFGFISNRPELGARLLRAHARALDVRVSADEAVGWGVGFYQVGELLLRRRPIDDRNIIAVATLAERVDTDILIGHVGRPAVGELRTENTQPFRYRQWLFAQLGSTQGYAQLRQGLLDATPEFLQRNRRGESDRELVFYATLATLHERDLLHAPLLSAEQLCTGLKAAAERLDQLSDRASLPRDDFDVLLTNGELLAVLHRSGTLASRRVAGRHEVEQILGDDLGSIARSQSTEKARCTVIAGPLAELPPSWQKLPQRSVLAWSRTEEPTVVAL